jgi:hypothetical protein
MGAMKIIGPISLWILPNQRVIFSQKLSRIGESVTDDLRCVQVPGGERGEKTGTRW